jgi:uncharacterized protein YxjI
MLIAKINMEKRCSTGATVGPDQNDIVILAVTVVIDMMR